MALEHVNLNVSDAHRTRDLLEEIFGWHTRWEGRFDYGYTVHVGDDQDYLSLNSYEGRDAAQPVGPVLNHVGIRVDGLEEIENRVVELGLEITGRGDYEPGRRFYFKDHDGIEFEVVSYS